MVMTDNEQKVIYRNFCEGINGEEKAARSYEELRDSNDNLTHNSNRGILGKIYNEIKDSFTRIRDTAFWNSKSLFGSVKNGAVWERPVRCNMLSGTERVQKMSIRPTSESGTAKRTKEIKHSDNRGASFFAKSLDK